MSYTEIKPNPTLAPYIDAFWICEGSEKATIKQTIMPDNCVDLIFNLAEECEADNGKLILHTEKIYLVGSMTTFKDSCIAPYSKMIGVRFRPAALSSFYNHASLHEFKNMVIEFEQSLLPDIHKVERYSTGYLNAFFINILNKEKHNLSKVVQDIEMAKGQIGMAALATQHHVTKRQLERDFKRYIGISPKEFANIVRFRTALTKIGEHQGQQNLTHIACDCGFYDHAHLCNEIKKYTGSVPSKI